jgi:ribosomal protein S15P/S13E
MRINSIELIGFKRMALNNVKRFKMIPQERYQLILGTNGSGKSSLMAELTPLPATPSSYSKYGMKTISITSQGSEYTLCSDFSKQKPHSFQKDGIELNPGGTITVQKELVKQEFGITPEIHALLTGKEKFTQMSPARRREWMTQLCETNYDYAIEIYNRIRERARDVGGALKLAKKRLVAEVAKTVTPEEVTKINTEIQNLLKDINALYESRSDEKRSPMDVLHIQDRYESEVIGISQRLFTLKSSFGRRLISPPESLQTQIDQSKQEIAAANALIENYTKEHKEYKEILEVYIKSGASDLENLKAQCDELIRQRAELVSMEKLKLVFEDTSQAHSALQSVYETLFECFSTIAENPTRKYSYQNLLDGREKESELKQKLLDANTRLEQLRHRDAHLKQLKAGEGTRCPKCSFTWILGYTEDEEIKVIRSIDQGVEFVQKKQAELEEVQETIAGNIEYSEKYKLYTRCVSNLSALMPFWDHLNHFEYVQNAPRFALSQLEILRNDLTIRQHIAELDKDIRAQNDRIQLAIKASSIDTKNTTTRIEYCEEQLGLLANKIKTLQAKLNQQNQDLTKVNELKSISDKIESLVGQLNKSNDDHIRAIRNQMINQTLNMLQLEVAEKQRVLSDIGTQQGIIRDLERNIENLTRDEAVYKLLVNSLSPTDGLIAEGLLGFIRNFVRKMNVVTKRVWTYPMVVQDCSSDTEGGADLDYKFPVVVQNNQDDPVDDISNASTGMKEMINLAFKVVAMHCLNLGNAPLMLDEFGAGFDETHRVNAGVMIKTLMEQHSFSQLFMISHYASTHGAFVNAEIAVICSTNIVLPTKDKYNTHVELS